MKTALVGLLSLTITLRAQTPQHPNQVRVSIQQFKPIAGTVELEPLRTILPNLLQGAFFQYKWLSADVRDPAAIQIGGSSMPAPTGTEGHYRIEGQFVPLGDKIRVDVLVRNVQDGSIASGEYEMFDEADINSAMQRLAARCARAMAPEQFSEEPGKEGDAIVAPTLAATSKSLKISYLQVAIPRAIVSAVNETNLVFHSGAITTGRRERFAVSGSLSGGDERVEALIRILDTNGKPLELRAATQDEAGFSLSGTVAAEVLEAVRGMILESKATDALYHPDARDAAALLRAGDAAREKLPELGVVMYRRAALANPSSLEATQRLIRMYIDRRSVAAALSEAEVLAGTDAKTGRFHYGRGLTAYLRADYKSALQEYRLALNSKPEVNLIAYVYRAMGDAQLARGTPEAIAEAIASYERAIETAPGNVEIVHALSYAYALAGKADEATAALERAHQQAPGNSEICEDLASLYRDRAATCYAAGQLDESLTWANKCLALSPQNKTVMSQAATYAAYALSAGHKPPKSEEARQLLIRATEADAKNEWALRFLASLYIDQKNWTAALDAAQRALSATITPEGYWTLADVYSGMDDTNRAVEALQKAIALEGSDKSETYVRLAQVYAGRGDNDLALRALEDAKKADPTNDSPWLNQGYILQSVAKYKKALTAYDGALKLKASRDAFFGKGEALMSERNYREAGDMFSRARLLDADCLACSLKQAQALAEQGKLSEATKMLDKELGPEWPPDLDYSPVIKVYAKTGKLAIAEAKLSAAAAKYPADAQLHMSLEYLWHEYTFEFRKDYDASRKALAAEPKDPDAQSVTAEAALTVGHYDEAIELASALLANKTISLQLRFPLHLIKIAALLGENNATDALLAIGSFISEYRAIPGDWDRSWTFNGFHEYISKSRDFSPTSREVLETMISSMKENRPKSDLQVAKVEVLVAGDSFRRLLDSHVQRAAVR